ncbi:MAG: CBS domain-containing protein [Candidatus Nitrosotenuis sp.]|uniref:Putative Inosine-5'-monophosphate dehydrogenase related protein II n=1 Tax=Candidatus Nitrosotenuis uzonensis TaxID=1407055 RepID=A0A812F1C0_9ARCH|nr:CBS domain-containing protein [Candidatus Nitrosotenuis uzonensis]CAE6487508.1 putative Inosine-5'-monophosphate dehydrogenase related protein II [Candidatus Nitrosotenuis uzonensis]
MKTMKLKNSSLDQVLRNSITVQQNSTLLEARDVLLRHKLSRLPVVDSNGRPVGMITEKDFVRTIYEYGGRSIEKILVRDFMSKNLITVKRSDTVYDCAKLMSGNKISSILVLNDDGKLAGIVTKTDLVSIFLTRATNSLSVSEIMTPHVITVMPADSLLLVESLLVKHKISRIVVERNKRPVGIITNRDFLPAKMPRWIRQFADPKEVEEYRLNPKPDEFRMNQLSYILSFRAEDIMTANPVTVGASEDVSVAALLMIRNGISGLPVVSKSKLVGIITKSDIVNSIAKR